MRKRTGPEARTGVEVCSPSLVTAGVDTTGAFWSNLDTVSSAPFSNQEWAQGLLVRLLGAAGMACPAPPSGRPVVVRAPAAA